MHRRRHLPLIAAAATLAACVLGAGCGGPARGPAATASPTLSPPAAQLAPPAWVQREALWRATYEGDPDPSSMRWALTPLRRAVSLLPADSFVRSFYEQQPGRQKVYLVVVTGEFWVKDAAPPSRARELLTIMWPTARANVIAEDSTSGAYDLSGIRNAHGFEAEPPVAAGVWGHTTWSGGPAPGRQGAVASAPIQVYSGFVARQSMPSQTPVATLRSDAGGFFTIELPDGEYTFAARTVSGWPQSIVTVTVVAGKLQAVSLVANVPGVAERRGRVSRSLTTRPLRSPGVRACLSGRARRRPRGRSSRPPRGGSCR